MLGVVPAGGGLPARLVVQACDVEDQRAAAERLEHEAAHDSLTGLPNRRALDRALQAVVAQPGGRGVVVLVDLDGFKAVNDRYGHEAMAVGRRVLSGLVGPARLRAGEVSLRASAGVCAVAAHDDPWAVLRDAGTALYEAKRSGGSVVRLAPRASRVLDGPVRASAPARTAAAGA